ncbi:methyltransferase domain-containing protein [Rheinheimera soli]|uniref:methyltransferase domain-containing protein n=1 Tax=Rheinheimera soli TaxID=443616 RepID=UPI00286D086F|nr:methyltransferase domain-containing protein [Rheinheimera soli]
MLPYFKVGNRLLDIGCSDGEFTELLARDSSYALGIDLSEALIEQAKKLYSKSNVLHFDVADIVQSELAGEFDIVACMGLFTCLTRRADFERTISHIMAILQPGGYLVLKDSLMLDGKDETYVHDNSYEAIYRSEADYLQAFTQFGLQVVQRHPLHRGGPTGKVSVLYLLHRPVIQPYLFLPKKATVSRMAILYQLPESWSNVRSVWLAAKARVDVEVVVVLLPFFHQQKEWRRSAVEQQLQKEGIEYISWDEFDVADAAFDIVLYTTPEDSSRPVPFQFPGLKSQVKVTAYIPYGLEVGGGAQNLEVLYRQPVVAGADAVFVRSSGVKKIFNTYSPTADQQVVVTGHPRMDGLIHLSEFDVDPQLVADIAGRTAVLWNAHFSFDEDLWSTFDLFAADILIMLLQRPDLVLIFRPHPLLWKRLIDLGIFNSLEVDELKHELRSLGIIVDERPDHRHAFAASCALMTDAGSFLLEYLVTEKPVLYLCNPKGMELNEQGQAVVNYYCTANTAADIATFIDNLLAATDPGRSARLDAIPDFFSHFDGHSGERIVQYLVNRLQQQTSRSTV